MRRSVGVVIMVASVALGACHSGPHRPLEVRVEGDRLEDVVYLPFGEARIPEADLSEIGTGSGDTGPLVRSSTVYAVRDLDPTQIVAMAIDADAYARHIADVQESEPDWRPPAIPPSHQLFVSASVALESLPEEMCRYFDPMSDTAPVQCQAPVTLSFDGRTYRALGRWDGKDLSYGWQFFRSDLEPLGEVAFLDPRLVDRAFDPAAYAIRGIGPLEVLVLAAGDGLATRHAVFLSEEVNLPTEVCDYVGRYPDEGIPCGGAVHEPPAAMQRQIDEQQETWYAHEAIEYRFTITVRCSCPHDTLGPFIVTVDGSDLVQGAVGPGAVSLDPDDPRLRWAPLRMNEAFEEVIRYSRADRLDVIYDEDYGFPRHVDADPSVQHDGDEYGFTITDFEIIR